MTEQLDHHRLHRITAQHLQSLYRAGVEQLRRPAAASARPAAEAAADASAGQADERRQQPAGSQMSTPDSDTSHEQLELVRHEVGQCTLCAELAETRTQTVFGVGNPQAKLCFLGEAPGADEDAQGEPFVGRAGQLLTKMIEAMTLSREDVYILNILKCRPPGNRNPSEEEADNCRNFLDRQLEIIQPDYICCLGAVAAQNLLRTKVSVGKLRGRLHAYGRSKVLVTYHPAYLLRNPAAKKPAWEDLKILMRELRLE